MKQFAVLILLFGALVVSACGAAEEAQAPTQHTLAITATAEGWAAPDVVPAGWTQVTLSNESDGLRQAAFLRLEDDKTMEDVFAAIEAGMEGPAPWMIAQGGISGVVPGAAATVTLDLPAGQYIVVDPVPGPDGVPGMAKGYFMPLVVESSDVATAPPTADLTVALIDYGFETTYDTFTAGSHTIQISNNGPQEAHEMVLVKLDDGATVQDFLAALAPDAAAGPPPGNFVAGTGAFITGADNFLDVDLEAGATYAVVCFLPSVVNEGQPHFVMGMVDQFTVASEQVAR